MTDKQQQKEVCSSCKKKVYFIEEISVNGKKYHKTCFSNQNFFSNFKKNFFSPKSVQPVIKN